MLELSIEQLTATEQAVIILFLIFNLVLFLRVFFMQAFFFRMKEAAGVSVAFILFLFWNLYLMSVIHSRARLDYWGILGLNAYRQMPAYQLVIFIILITAYSLGKLFVGQKRIHSSISAHSISEAFDCLNEAFCFARPDGSPVLTNRQMYALVQDYLGRSLQNLNAFWDEICKHRLNDTPSDNMILVRWPNGQVWQFKRYLLNMDGDIFWQVSGIDITKLYELTDALARTNKRLDEQHERTKDLLNNIAQVTQEKEVLASKVRVHAAFGEGLLATRRFLIENKNCENIEQIIEMWHDIIERIEVSTHDQIPIYDDTLATLLKASEALGCQIEFQGDLPEDRELRYLVLMIIREALINAVRHAEANHIFVELIPENRHLFVRIRDNGTSCPNHLNEGGGLSGLRKKIAEAGGEMHIRLEDGVVLEVKLLWPIMEE